jgi:hypothetical protein
MRKIAKVIYVPTFPLGFHLHINGRSVFGAKMHQNSSAIYIVEPQPVIATPSATQLAFLFL